MDTLADWITVAQAAVILQVGVRQVRRYAALGQLPSLALNPRMLLVSRAACENFQARQVGNPNFTGKKQGKRPRQKIPKKNKKEA